MAIGACPVVVGWDERDEASEVGGERRAGRVEQVELPTKLNRCRDQRVDVVAGAEAKTLLGDRR
jgi:hypothetical protein